MIGIYLLVTIFTQLSPLTQLTGGSIWSIPTILTTAPEESVEIQVAFDDLNGLRIGSPVLVDGRRVGNVASISQPEAGAYEVSLTITSDAAYTLGTESIALQASPMSVSRIRPETVVELLSLPGQKGVDLKGGEKIAGFSSLEEFWTAPLTPRS